MLPDKPIACRVVTEDMMDCSRESITLRNLAMLSIGTGDKVFPTKYVWAGAAAVFRCARVLRLGGNGANRFDYLNTAPPLARSPAYDFNESWAATVACLLLLAFTAVGEIPRPSREFLLFRNADWVCEHGAEFVAKFFERFRGKPCDAAVAMMCVLRRVHVDDEGKIRAASLVGVHECDGKALPSSREAVAAAVHYEPGTLDGGDAGRWIGKQMTQLERDVPKFVVHLREIAVAGAIIDEEILSAAKEATEEKIRHENEKCAGCEVPVCRHTQRMFVLRCAACKSAFVGGCTGTAARGGIRALFSASDAAWHCAKCAAAARDMRRRMQKK